MQKIRCLTNAAAVRRQVGCCFGAGVVVRAFTHSLFKEGARSGCWFEVCCGSRALIRSADHDTKTVLTMYLKVDEGFADRELALLTDLLELLDAKLAGIQDAIASNADPESAGLTDQGEYFIGVGLCAVQQYLVDT